MQIQRAYTYMFSEDDWIVKGLIGTLMALFSWLLIPAFILQGYSIAIARRVRDGLEPELPQWDDWGQLLKDGFFLTAAQFIWALPIILLSVCIFPFLIPAMADGSGELSGAGVAAVVLISCVQVILGILVALVTPVIAAQYIRTGDFGAMLQVREIIEQAREHLGDVLIIVLAGIGAGLIVALVSVVIPICGWFFGAFVGAAWIAFATGHLYGQLAARLEGKSGKSPDDFAYTG